MKKKIKFLMNIEFIPVQYRIKKVKPHLAFHDFPGCL